MASPARQHKQKILAAQAAMSMSSDDEVVRGSAYELMLEQMGQQKRDLKSIKSMVAKNEAKAAMLPEWTGYIDGVLTADTGASDSIIGQLLIWSIDVAEYDQAISIGAYMLKHDIALPEQFERDTVDAFAEELADAWIKNDEPSIKLVHLKQAHELVIDYELFDEVRAKLLRALGEASYEAGAKYETSINYLDAAVTLNPRVGCKPLLTKLQKLQLEAADNQDNG
ncbi:phage terminase small subunit [Psychrobacter sp.]|uniref:phage terminase small subunit n=1 Tax=Psychrobacter sp. TaxID=56811 RepID=UPI003BAF9D7B